jgi:hypothetical protein
MSEPTILLDDGEYFIEHNQNYPADRGNGFLMRRCQRSLTAPEGAEVVGGYGQKVDGKWHADIQAHHDTDPDADCRVVGVFDERLDAIHALWAHRHEAMTRHPR